jgi:hypothetical protein
MPIIKGWGNKQYNLDWEMDQVAFLYDSKPGPKYYMFPMTGLLPINQPSIEDIQNSPSPLWITYLDPDSAIGKIDSKGDRTYRITLPASYEEYIASLSYDNRKEMRYVQRRAEDLVFIENQKQDLLEACDEYFAQINQRAVSEGEIPFSEAGIQTLKDIFPQECVHTISIFAAGNPKPIAINVSFRANSVVYDSFCIRSYSPEYKKLSLGTVAILKNIEFAIRDGFKVYDMLTGDWGYKTKFGAVATALKTYIKCNRDFASHYQIPLDDISEILD